MNQKKIFGYMGQILRVDLSSKKSWKEELDEATCRKYVGGISLGSKYLYEEVPAGIEWSSPENRLILMTGPLSGTRVAGSGTFCAVSKGPLTNMAASTQANGFLGAFLRFSGFDGLVIQGCSSIPVYLYIHEGKIEFRDASHLEGKGTLETERTIKSELQQGRKVSVYAIGPAGENLVRFAAIIGDGGHAASHNGVGSVMGSKNLKAIAVHYGSLRPPIEDPDKLSSVAKRLLEHAKNVNNGMLYKWGTNNVLARGVKAGFIPIKNYTTSILHDYEKLLPEYTRTHFEIKSHPCWSCGLAHVKHVRVTEGPYKDHEGEEPEFECVNAWGPLTGNNEPGAVVMLSNLTDNLGLDVNEAGWTIAWVMECFEKGLLTKADTDGLEMTWGNVEAVRNMLEKIARRDGFGDILAEGIKRASEQIGGQAAELAVYTHKGNTPRSHDHRARWTELLDTCLSDTGTIEVTYGALKPEKFGGAPVKNQFSAEEVARANALVSGWSPFVDCLGVCRFCVRDNAMTLESIGAVTGWEMDFEEAMRVGIRSINLLRVFNLKHGLRKESERPSSRYGSTPVDGPAEGIGIMPVWDEVVKNYYSRIGWDPETGMPLPETLRSLGLDYLIQDLKTVP
jgi:aldehyde:ferredoxin oxidoreductase